MKLYLNLSDSGEVLSAGMYLNAPNGNCVEADSIPTENGMPIDVTRIACRDGSMIIKPKSEPTGATEPPTLEQRIEAVEAAMLDIIMGVSL